MWYFYISEGKVILSKLLKSCQSEFQIVRSSEFKRKDGGKGISPDEAKLSEREIKVWIEEEKEQFEKYSPEIFQKSKSGNF